MNFFDPMKFKTPKLGIFVELIFKNKVMKCIIGFVLKFYAQIVSNRSRKNKKWKSWCVENTYDFLRTFLRFFGPRSVQKWGWIFQRIKIGFYMIF